MIYLSKDKSYDILAARGMMCSNKKDVYNFLYDRDYKVRTLAAQTIQTKYPTKQSFKIANKMLLSNNTEDVKLGIYILGQLGTPDLPFKEKTIPILLNLLEEKRYNENIIIEILHALSHLCSLGKCNLIQDYILKIANFTQNDNIELIIAALMALSSQYNNPIAKNTIKKFLKSNNKELAEWAEVAYDIFSSSLLK